MIVDTSVWIDFFNGHPSWQAKRLQNAISDNEQIHLPGIVLTEILLGLSSDKEAEKVADLLSAFSITKEMRATDYKQAAMIYRQCRTKGKTIRSTIDCMIATLCLRDGLPLLSKDRDFNFIAEYFSLKMVT